MFKLRIKSKPGRSLSAALNRLGGEVAGRTKVRAINRVATTINGRAARAIAKDLRITQKDVRAALRVESATFQKPEAILHARSKRFPVYDLRPRRVKGGITYQGLSGRKFIPSAFIATMKTGHIGVFKRKLQTRLPIKELRAVSVPWVLRKFAGALRVIIRERMPIEIAQALKFYSRRGAS